MNKRKMYVIQFGDGRYYCGPHTGRSDDITDAQIFHNLELMKMNVVKRLPVELEPKIIEVALISVAEIK